MEGQRREEAERGRSGDSPIAHYASAKRVTDIS